MRSSNSYLLFKKSIQEVFNFAVIVTAGIPVLKENIKIYRKGIIKKLPDPDYFEPSVMYEIKEPTLIKLTELGIDESKIAQLKKILNKPLNNREFKSQVISAIGEELYKKHRDVIKTQSMEYIDNIEACTKDYQKRLATYLYFSTFSYFEAYITDLSKETISQFAKLDKADYLLKHKLNQDLINYRIKLGKVIDPRKKSRYIKFSRKLNSEGYKPPEEIVFSSFIDLFMDKLSDLKANDIPVFLDKYFLYNMPESERQVFHTIRNNRNSIGHGDKAYTPTLSDVIEANKFFKKVSAEIDSHIMFHFDKLQNYQSGSS